MLDDHSLGSDDDLLAPDDPSQWEDDLPGQPTEGNQKKRIALRREREEQEQRKTWERWKRQQKKQYDPHIIAKNLQALMASKGLSIQDTTKAISEHGQYHPKDYRWLKRVSAEGVVQTDGRTVARLQRLADFFGIPLEQLRTYDLTEVLRNEVFRRYDNPEFRRYGCMLDELLKHGSFEFLEPLLVSLHLETDGPSADDATSSAEQDFLTGGSLGKKCQENPHQRCMRMLYRLLDTGTHEYLKDLLAELYARTTRETAEMYKEFLVWLKDNE